MKRLSSTGRVQGSLKNVKGVTKSDWDKGTKMMEVTFDAHLISLDDIKKKIAYVGYDTEEHRASDDTYDKLHGCCKYDRPEGK